MRFCFCLLRAAASFLCYGQGILMSLLQISSVSVKLIARNKLLEDCRKEPYWHTRVQSSHNKLVHNGDIHASPHRRGLWRLTKQGKHRALQIAAQTASHAFADCILPVPSPEFRKPIEEWEEFAWMFKSP